MAALLWALMALVAAQAGRPDPFLKVSSLERVTAYPAVRNHTATAPGGGPALVVWEEAGGLDWNGQPVPPVHLALSRPGNTGPGGIRYSTQPGNQMGPALAECFGVQWLAWYAAKPTRQTGDRDVAVAPMASDGPAWDKAVPVSRDRAGAGPINDSSPALACDPAAGQLLVVWSAGRYDPRLPGGYRDKDILQVGLDSAGSLATPRHLTSGRDRLWEMTPAIAVLPSDAGGGYLLAFIGDSTGSGRYDLLLRHYDRGWALRSERRVTAGGGVSHPSLALLGDGPVLLWLDHRDTDVRLARVAPDLSISAPLSLRTLLSSRLRAEGLDSLAPLFGASLQPDQGGLVVPFLAGVSRDVYLARLARSGAPPR